MKNRVHTERAPAFSIPWLFLGTAELCAVGGLVIVAGHADGVAFRRVSLPAVVAATHLFTLGTITMAMMGALYQWIPVVADVAPVPARASQIQFGLMTAGVIFFVLGLSGGEAALLGLGGMALEASIFLFLRNIVAMGLPLPARLPGTAFVVSGLVYLGATAILGGLMAFRLATGGDVPAGWLEAHLIVGIGGFAGFVLVGVSYRLIPMFLPAAPHATRSGWVLCLAHGAIVTGLLSAAFPLFPGGVPLFFLTGAVLLYLLDIARYWADRRPRKPDALLLLLAASHLSLLTAAAIALVAGLTGRNLWPGVVAVSILGWYLLAILAFSQKILPFVGWLHGMRSGRRTTPHITALWPPTLGWATSTTALLGSGGLVVGVLSGTPSLVRVGAGVLGGAILLFHGAFWRMWRLIRR